jgi:tryptophan 2,3-dioxygenase
MTDWVILGCGYVGSRLAKELLAERVKVRTCARHLDRLTDLATAGAAVHQLDAAKVRAFGPALYNLRSPVVVYSIPPVVGMPPGEAIRRASEAAMSAGAQRFIYLSSTAVYGETPDGEIVDEETAIAMGDSEAQTRIAEEFAVESARLAGLSTVVLRLAAIYGPGRGVRERLKAGTYKLLDEGSHYFSRVHVDDVVGVIRAAAERATGGAVYCVGDDRPTTQREYSDWLTARLGTPPPPSEESLAQGKPRRLVRNRKLTNAKLKRELQYSFRYPTYVEGELAIERESGPQNVTVPPAVAAPPAPVAAPEIGPAVAPVIPKPAPAVTSDDRPQQSANSKRAEASTPTRNPFDDRYDSGASEYERYLKTADLLSLQKPPVHRSHPDELFFQVVHQVEELWMKVMIHELGETVVHSDADRFVDARASLRRVAELGELLERQLKLFETMLPSAYLVIRKQLGHGSGLDSPGFVRINALAPSLWACFQRALERHRIDLMKLYAEPSTHPGLLGVAEGLVDLDEAMQRFKREHLLVVRRIIGIGTASLRGNPMDLLEKSAQLTYFPSLWAVRDGMFIDFKAGELES